MSDLQSNENNFPNLCFDKLLASHSNPTSEKFQLALVTTLTLAVTTQRAAQ